MEVGSISHYLFLYSRVAFFSLYSILLIILLLLIYKYVNLFRKNVQVTSLGSLNFHVPSPVNQ